MTVTDITFSKGGYMKIFVTGASGWIGSAVVPELIGAGHQVIGLARSDESAKQLEGAGVEVVRGTLDDIQILKDTAAASDGVIHLAFKHDVAFIQGDFAAAALADRQAVEAFGEALAGSDKPFVLASGIIGINPGQVATEQDGLESKEAMNPRMETAHVALALADKGVRTSIVRLAPTVHGEGDNGFMLTIASLAKKNNQAGYINDGANRWPATHRLDAAVLFRLAVEKAPAGSVLHAIAEEGVAMKDIVAAIGEGLSVPVVSISADDASKQFGHLAGFAGLDSPASSDATRKLLGWEPTHATLIEDIKSGYYFKD